MNDKNYTIQIGDEIVEVKDNEKLFLNGEPTSCLKDLEKVLSMVIIALNTNYEHHRRMRNPIAPLSYYEREEESK